MAITTTIIFNPNSGSAARWDAWLEDRGSRSDTRVCRTAQAGDATDFARQACRAGDDRIVAVGGDGTLHEVVNGLMSQGDRPDLAPLPGGTGNDFVSSFDAPEDPDAAGRWLDGEPDSLSIDVFAVQAGIHRCWGLNALHGGYAGRVSQDVDSKMKERLGPLAYLAALPAARRNEPDYETHITWGNGEEEVVDAVDVIVANGTSIGGGFPVAQTSELDDGVLEALVVRAGGLLDLAGVAAKLASGHLLDSDYVIHRPIQSATIETVPPMSFNVDGEPIQPMEPTELSVDVHPQALSCVRPPEHD
jgi:YegS/Rv2252/BmrU family lipid kinase